MPSGMWNVHFDSTRPTQKLWLQFAPGRRIGYGWLRRGLGTSPLKHRAIVSRPNSSRSSPVIFNPSRNKFQLEIREVETEQTERQSLEGRLCVIANLALKYATDKIPDPSLRPNQEEYSIFLRKAWEGWKLAQVNIVEELFSIHVQRSALRSSGRRQIGVVIGTCQIRLTFS